MGVMADGEGMPRRTLSASDDVLRGILWKSGRGLRAPPGVETSPSCDDRESPRLRARTLEGMRPRAVVRMRSLNVD